MVSNKAKRQQIKLGRTGAKSCYGRTSDTHKLRDVSLDTYAKLPAPSISDLIMYYNGDKFTTVRALIGENGTRQQYVNMLNNVNRYLRKARSPNKAMQTRFKELYLPDSTKNLQVRIRGCVQVSNEYYYKDSTWHKPIIIPASEVKAFLQASIENNAVGYQVLNGIYMRSGLVDDTFNWLDNVEIDMSFI